MVLAGNGSDDLLTIITRAFVGPGDLAAFPSPSYLLYSTLVALQDGRSVVVPYTRDWTLEPSALAVPGLKLFFLANPDSPSGTALTREQVAELAGSLDCPLVVDEAYADFADPRYHAMPLLEDHPNVIVTRSFSKGYSLAGIRLGYLVARAEIVAHLIKVKDSYNCDMLSQVAGVAAPAGPGLPGGDAGEDPGDPEPADRRASVDGVHGPRQPVQLRLGDRRPAGPGDLPAAQGPARSWSG